MTQPPENRIPQTQGSIDPMDELGRLISFWSLVWGGGFIIVSFMDTMLKASGLIPLSWRLFAALLIALGIVLLVLRWAHRDVMRIAYQGRYLIIFTLGWAVGVYWLD